MIRYVFNLIMLGILFSQVWHWAAWTKKEKPLIKIIVVSPVRPFDLKNTADVLVVGIVLLFGFELVLYGLVLSTVCGPLWQIRPICR